ncbi:uncharacterized protein LOC134217255 [Armigeres subalbatus]|uniref:uncharacterized protein LOC134217255 n=1 Tax=Armigeres subalbatus TaxID=124917 RepID=UPI002ED5D133
MKPVKHSAYLLNGIRTALSALSQRSYTITMAWVPSHCSIPGNEKADSLAKVGAMEGDIYDRKITFDEFFTLVRQETLNSWQQKWTNGELGRWLYSIRPQVSKRPWFKKLNMGRDFIRTMCRLMSNHYTLNAHLFRVGLSEGNLCVCGEDYQDIDHVVWACKEHRGPRSALTEHLRVRGKQPKPIREVLSGLDLEYMSLVHQFLKVADVKL